MFGFLNLQKPPGWTSHDCVARVRRVLKTRRVGHGGTLDPMATGVLPIAVGPATRLLPYLPGKKVYRARVRFGMTTDTDDLEGETLRVSPARELSLETVRGYLPRFVGSIAQVPPVYSAIHRDGKRLYELARRGEAVEVSPRNVEIYGITVSGWSSGEFPELELTIECGTGTYIRSIARDLGNLVGTGGTLAGLVRVESCGLELDGSLDPETLDPDGIHEVLLSPRVALKQLEFRRLSPAEALDWSHGRPIPLASGRTGECMGAESDENKFLGIGRVAGDPGVCFLQPKVVLT